MMRESVESIRPALPSEAAVVDIGNSALPDFSPIFWRAKFLRETPVLHHLPLLFWLVDATRPRCAVTLGDVTGVAHFALCQAVERLSLDARCHLAADWDRAQAQFDDVARYGHSEYREISKIARLAPQATMRALPRASVDLLVVDLPLDDDTLERLEFDWSARLASGATLVLHGGRDRLHSAAGQAYLHHLSQSRTLVEFALGEGILIAVARDGAPERMRRLALLQREDGAQVRVRRVLARLAQAHLDEIEKDGIARRAEAALAALRAERDAAIVGQPRPDGAGASPADAQADHRIAALVAERNDARAAERAEAEARAAVEAERDALRAELALREQALADRAADGGEVAALRSALATAQGEVDRMNAELAALVTHLEVLTLDRDAAQLRAAEAQATASDAAQEASLRDEIARLEAAVASVEVQRLEHAAALSRTAEALETTRRQLAEQTAKSSRADRELARLTTLSLKGQGDAELLRLLATARGRNERSGLKRVVRDYRAHFGLPPVRRQIEMVRAAEAFDAAWYAETYPDVAESGLDPAEHYVRVGALEGRNPGPDFDTLVYYARHRDIARRGLNPLVHHLVTREADASGPDASRDAPADEAVR